MKNLGKWHSVSLLLLFAVLALSVPAHAGNVITNGSFDNGLTNWVVDPALGTWDPIDNGTVKLHPDMSNYTGTLIYQNLNVTGVGGKTFTFSMKLTSPSPMSSGSTIAVYLSYVTTANQVQRVKICNPANTSITADPITASYTFPSDARKLVKIEIAKEYYGEYNGDDISLDGDGAPLVIPVITSLSTSSGNYGTTVAITGQPFGTTQGSVTINGSAAGVTIQSWSNTSVTVTVADPVASGPVRVVVDFVESNPYQTFQVTSPYFAISLPTDRKTVVKGEKPEFVIRTAFFNGFATTGGISFSLDNPTLAAVATFITPSPKAPGGSILRMNTSSLTPGVYQGKIQTTEGSSQPRYASFTLTVVTVDHLTFYEGTWENQTYNETELTSKTVTRQNQVSGVAVKAIGADGQTISMAPITYSSSNPSVLAIYPDNFGQAVYAVESGNVTVTATTPDGTSAQLPVTVTLPETPKITDISLSPFEVTNAYTGTIAFYAHGSEHISHGSYGMLGVTNDTRDWSENSTTVSGTFKLDLTTPPALGVYRFSATTDGPSALPAQRVTGLTVTNDPGYALLKGGARPLSPDIYGQMMENFDLEFYDQNGTKQFSRHYETYMMQDVLFEVGAIVPGTYRIKFVPQSGVKSQWYPNAADISGATPVTFVAGQAVTDIYFFGEPTPPAPNAQVWTESVTFGTVHLGGSVPDSSVQVYNGGTLACNITSVTITGPDASLFTEDANPPIELGKYGSKTIYIGFVPSSVGPKSATLTINTDDPNHQTFTVPLSATVLPQAGSTITVCPATPAAGNWDQSTGLSALAQEISIRTGLNTSRPAPVDLTSIPSSCDLIYMAGDTAFSLTDAQRANLKAYLKNGGFLFAEDGITTGVDSPFQASMRQEMQNIFGTDFSTLPATHPIFSIFYSMTGAPATDWNSEPIEGIDIGQKTVALFSENQYSRAWAGEGPAEAKENAFALGANIALYASANKAIAYPYTISGTVKDFTTGEPIPGATVTATAYYVGTVPAGTAVTDGYGHYIIGLASPGDYELRAIKTGFTESNPPQVPYTVDDAYNDVVIDVLFLTYSVADFPMVLKQGWNLASLPLQPLDNLWSSLPSDIRDQIIVIWAYSPTTGWLYYTPLDPDGSPLKIIEAGRGYWIKMKADKSFTLTGSPASPAIVLVPGWNLVGLLSVNSLATADALSSLGTNYTIVWGFKVNAWSLSYRLDSSKNTMTNFEPGFGYWIKVGQGQTWVLP